MQHLTFMSEDTHLEPAASIIEKLGGPQSAATICGVRTSTVYRWMWPRKPLGHPHRGTGGMIPSGQQERIMEWSRANGNPITPTDFFKFSRAPVKKARSKQTVSA